MNSAIFRSTFLLLALCIFQAVGAEKTLLEQLDCDETYCDKVAQKVAFVSKPLKDPVNIKTNLFMFDVPDRPIRRIASLSNMIIIYYRDGQVLMVSEKRAPDVQGLDENLAYQLPGITFTKTTKDPLPETLPEAEFWKIGLINKKFYFNEANDVFYMENGDLSYFVSDSADMGFSGSAMITTPKFKDVFWELDAKKMDFELFKQVVSSVKTNH